MNINVYGVCIDLFVNGCVFVVTIWFEFEARWRGVKCLSSSIFNNIPVGVSVLVSAGEVGGAASAAPWDG